jgi:hypothetical protein
VPILPKHRLIWVAACLAPLVVVAAGLVVTRPSGYRGPFWDKYQAARLGMTRQEAKGILGPSVTADGLSPDRPDTHWSEGSQTFCLHFGPNGRVDGKGFHPGGEAPWVGEGVAVYEENPTWLDRVQWRLERLRAAYFPP